MLDVSIVIVNYNTAEYLKESIESILSSDISLSQIEVIVVDNASSDLSVKKLEDFISLNSISLPIKIIINDDNLGFSKSVNIGIGQSRANYTCILNPDTNIMSNCLSGLIDYMNSNPDIDAITPKILNSDGSLQNSCKRSEPGILNSIYRILGFDKIFPNSRHFASFHLLYLNENKISQVEVISGAFMFLRSSTIEKVGLFDENFYLYCEDTDYCVRINNLGGKIVYYPLLKAIHHRGKSAESRPFDVIFYLHSSMIKYYNKYQNNYKFWKFLKPVILFSIIVRKYLFYFKLVVKKFFKIK
tara:strand:+ start:2625 stop:3527 length:903 start_codon:yes stop_codon:yes gene_type:complete